MREVKLKISEKIDKYAAVIGRVGEYGVTEIVADLSEYVENYGTGTASATFTPMWASESYLLDSTYADGYLYIPVSATETEKAGRHTIVINYYPTDAKAITADIKAVVVTTGQKVTGETPEEVKSWIDDATLTLAELQTAIADLPEEVQTQIVAYWTEHKDELKGDKGDDGSDADVTAENIKNALGYTPADDADISEINADLNEKIGYVEYLESDSYLYCYDNETDKNEICKCYIAGGGSTGGITEARCRAIIAEYGYITADDLTTALSDYAKSTDLTAVSDRVTDIEGKEATWNAKATSASVTAVANRVTAIEDKESTWNAKQDALTAGTNITIEDNVISATGGSGGSTVTADQVLTEGTEIGGVTIDGERTAFFAPSGGDSDYPLDLSTIYELADITVESANYGIIDTGLTYADLKEYKMFTLAMYGSTNVTMNNGYFKIGDSSLTYKKTLSLLRLNGFRGIYAGYRREKNGFVCIGGGFGNITSNGVHKTDNAAYGLTINSSGAPSFLTICDSDVNDETYHLYVIIPTSYTATSTEIVIRGVK